MFHFPPSLISCVCIFYVKFFLPIFSINGRVYGEIAYEQQLKLLKFLEGYLKGKKIKKAGTKGFRKRDVGITIFDMIAITYKFKDVTHNIVPHALLRSSTNDLKKHCHRLWRFLYPLEYVHSVPKRHLYTTMLEYLTKPRKLKLPSSI